VFTRVTGLKTNVTAREDSSTTKATYTLEIGMMTRPMEKVTSSILTEPLMREIGRMMLRVVTEKRPGMMVQCTKDSTKIV
jgi:hypothetical protein